MTAPQITLLTGKRGSGKTFFCQQVVEHAHAASRDAAGLLSPAVMQGSAKTGILAQDIRSGETRALASSIPNPAFSLPLGMWHFNPDTLTWGNRVLEACLPCDLLIIDELGPLELQQNAGWVSALTTLRQPGYRHALVVVRPELLEVLTKLLPASGNLHLDQAVSIENQARAFWERISHA